MMTMTTTTIYIAPLSYTATALCRVVDKILKNAYHFQPRLNAYKQSAAVECQQVESIPWCPTGDSESSVAKLCAVEMLWLRKAADRRRQRGSQR